MNKKQGFTLAEVLITLGIIGVVAALTIPTLISNYQKKTWTAQLKKSHALLNQGFRRMLADDNVTELSATETFMSIGGDEYPINANSVFRVCAYSQDIDSDRCKDFYTNLRKYFKIADIRKLTADDKYKTYYLNGGVKDNQYTYTAITLMDGTMLIRSTFYTQDTRNKTNNEMRGQVGEFYIDVNGLKKPNKLGRDIFYFYLGDNGIVYPVGSQAYSEYEYGNKRSGYWKVGDSSSNYVYRCGDNGNGYGYYCAARVLEEGNMNYKDNGGSY